MILLVAALLLTAEWIVRFTLVNAACGDVDKKVYQTGETIPMEGDFLMNDLMTGYEVVVKSAAIRRCEAFAADYGKTVAEIIPEDTITDMPPDRILDITLTVRNTNTPETDIEAGIDFFQYGLVTETGFYDLNFPFYGEANKTAGGSLSIRLRPGTEMDFRLPWNLRREHFTKRDWARLGALPWRLVVTKYPVEKSVMLSVDRSGLSG